MLFLSLMNRLGFVGPALFVYSFHACFKILLDLVLQEFACRILLVYFLDFLHILSLLQMILYFVNTNLKNDRIKSYVYFWSTIYSIFSLIIMGILFFDVTAGLISSMSCNYYFYLDMN